MSCMNPEEQAIFRACAQAANEEVVLVEALISLKKTLNAIKTAKGEAHRKNFPNRARNIEKAFSLCDEAQKLLIQAKNDANQTKKFPP